MCWKFNDLSNQVCVPNKTEDLNLSMFKMIIGRNESKILTKHISCKCKYKFDVIQINGGITINVDVSVKSVTHVKKIIFGILPHLIVKMKKYLASIMDDSAIMCDEIIESYNEETNFNEKKQPVKHKISISYLHFY